MKYLLGDIQGSLKAYQEVVKISEHITDPLNKCKIFCQIYEKLIETQAQEYQQEALRILEEYIQSTFKQGLIPMQEVEIYIQIAETFIKSGKRDGALEILEIALEKTQKLNLTYKVEKNIQIIDNLIKLKQFNKILNIISQCMDDLVLITDSAFIDDSMKYQGYLMNIKMKLVFIQESDIAFNFFQDVLDFVRIGNLSSVAACDIMIDCTFKLIDVSQKEFLLPALKEAEKNALNIEDYEIQPERLHKIVDLYMQSGFFKDAINILDQILNIPALKKIEFYDVLAYNKRAVCFFSLNREHKAYANWSYALKKISDIDDYFKHARAISDIVSTIADSGLFKELSANEVHMFSLWWKMNFKDENYFKIFMQSFKKHPTIENLRNALYNANVQEIQLK